MKVFGTDGVRSKANGDLMNPVFLIRFIQAIFIAYNWPKKVLIVKDTRRSGYMVESAVASAVMACGGSAILVGPAPTPVLPLLIKEKKADLGLMISASHNEHADNGIKIFGPDGFKISEENERKIEAMLKNGFAKFVEASNIGVISRIHNANEQYVNSLIQCLNDYTKDLSGVKIVIDCANGSGYKAAGLLFARLKADFVLINNKPNGFNINEKCGAVHPEFLSQAVIANRATLGVALDGDADRAVFCDENGVIVDTDKIIATIAKFLKNFGKLTGDTIGVNITSNLGLDEHLKKYCINVTRVPVGDKHLANLLVSKNYAFGAEKSGHFVFNCCKNSSFSGDGLFTAAFVAHLVYSSGLKFSEILAPIKLFLQAIKNIDCEDSEILKDERINNKILDLEKLLGNRGRILVRRSGTEKKIRLIAEGADQNLVNNAIEDVARLFVHS